MNEKVEQFLQAKKQAVSEQYEKEKSKFLFELGLFEKEYSPNNEFSSEYYFSEWDGSATKYFKKVPVQITDEEYEEIKKYANIKTSDNGRNIVADMLTAIAVAIYVIGFIASFFLGVNGYGEISDMLIVWWIVFFVAGTIYLGFAEIIKLLQNIKNK